jgi:hypothetical protein
VGPRWNDCRQTGSALNWCRVACRPTPTHWSLSFSRGLRGSLLEAVQGDDGARRDCGRRGIVDVVVASYTEEMERFIAANPGLQSRFSTTIHFDDYRQDDLSRSS